MWTKPQIQNLNFRIFHPILMYFLNMVIFFGYWWTIKIFASSERNPNFAYLKCIFKEALATILTSFSKGEKWYDKLFNAKYLPVPLFHHFKAIYQFPKHIMFLVKIVANASLINKMPSISWSISKHEQLHLFPPMRVHFITFISYWNTFY
jgi:hypothetical protein